MIRVYEHEMRVLEHQTSQSARGADDINRAGQSRLVEVVEERREEPAVLLGAFVGGALAIRHVGARGPDEPGLRVWRPAVHGDDPDVLTGLMDALSQVEQGAPKRHAKP